MMRPDHPWRRRGQAHPAAKLRDSERDLIRQMRADGTRPKKLAAHFNISMTTVYRIGR